MCLTHGFGLMDSEGYPQLATSRWTPRRPPTRLRPMRPRHCTGPADLEGHGRLRRRAGELLRQRRLAAGISQDRLASATNLSQALISRVERGLHPASLDVLERLFEGLDLDLHVEAKPVHADLDRE